MKEDFLHYVWQYKKFDFLNLKTVSGESLSITHSGQYLQQSGPDFFNAQLVIGAQQWAGNVELHVKSSDWYLHHHENDTRYESVILHVVWEYDAPVFRKDNTEIPVLELKHYVSHDTLSKYHSLTAVKSWIYCENEIDRVDAFVFHNWKERLFFERLERKADFIKMLSDATGNDWEAVLFYLLAKNFGLNANGETFYNICQSISFSVLRKESAVVENLEALLFGSADLFPNTMEDHYGLELQSRFHYLKQKYQLESPFFDPLQFYKLRPVNFPTIRLAQLAMLFHKRQNLFSLITEAQSVRAYYDIFNISVSDYWETHHHFDKKSIRMKKKLSKNFIDLLLINTIVPIRFAYAKSEGREVSESLVQLLQDVGAEQNVIINKFKEFGIKAKNAFESQSLLQMKQVYCERGKCLQCAIGNQLLKS